MLALVDDLEASLPSRPRMIFEGPLDSVVSVSRGDELVTVLQELLSNVARHAHASHVDVTVAVDDEVVWIEVVDDRVLQVRTFLTVAQAGRVEVGRNVVAHQGDRTYAGRVDAIGALADERTHLIPALVRAENTDRKLKIHTEVTVDFLASSPSAL